MARAGATPSFIARYLTLAGMSQQSAHGPASQGLHQKWFAR
jgi:hypothetical protein